MGKTDLELEREADELLKQGNEELFKKNYDLAIHHLYKSRYLNFLLGFAGQANKVEIKLNNAKKFAARYDKSKRFSLAESEKKILEEEARLLADYSKNLEDRKRIEDAIMHYQEAFSIFDRLNKEYESKQMFWKINKIEEELKLLPGQKRDIDRWSNIADKAVELGKLSVRNNDYDIAKNWYKEAIDIYKELSFFDVVGNLYKERENIENIKTQKLKQKSQFVKDQETAQEQFQTRVDDELEKKEKKEQELLERLREMPPEIQEKLSKANMLMEKIKKELQMEKFQRVLGRYQIILDMYNSIPKEIIDLSSKISEIEQKISDLKSKI